MRKLIFWRLGNWYNNKVLSRLWGYKLRLTIIESYTAVYSRDIIGHFETYFNSRSTFNCFTLAATKWTLDCQLRNHIELHVEEKCIQATQERKPLAFSSSWRQINVISGEIRIIARKRRSDISKVYRLTAAQSDLPQLFKHKSYPASPSSSRYTCRSPVTNY